MASSSTSKSTSTTTKKTTATKSSATSSTAKKSSTSSKASTTKKSSSSTTSKKVASQNHTEEAKKESKSQLTESIANKTGLDKDDVSKALKEVSKFPLGGKIAVIACALVGLAGGYFASQYVQRNDQFTLINGNSYTVNVGDSFDYNDISANVIAIAYGKNIANQVKVDVENTTVDFDTVGEYKITYVCDNIKYKNVPLVQALYVIEAEASVTD